jgi:poly(U)-binding-splicing factor PUF60
MIPSLGHAGALEERALVPRPVMPPSATNPAGLYGFQGMMDDTLAYPPGFENAMDIREPSPPPPVERLPGFLEDPPAGLKEAAKLIHGAGAKRDASGVLGMGLPKLDTKHALLVQRAKKYAMEVSIKMVLMKQTLAHQQQQTKYLERQQAVALMSRIFVGGLNYETTEDQIKRAFLTFGPVKSITTSLDSMTGKHKGFAFVEFDQPEAAHIALDQPNGVMVMGKTVKVGWPSQMPQAQAKLDEIRREAQAFNRIYVAGIHKDLQDDDIRTVFSAFGPIKSCELASAGLPGRHKGYGYIEYETLQSTQEAISSMNMFDLGGQLLRVSRAVAPPGSTNQGQVIVPRAAMPSAAAVAAAAATAQITAMDAVASNFGVNAQHSGGMAGTGAIAAANPIGKVPFGSNPFGKCGLPRDELGRPIKTISQMGGGVADGLCGPKKIKGVGRSPTPPRRRSRSPRRSRDRDSRTSRGRSRSRSRDRRSRRRSRSRTRSKDRKDTKDEKEALPPPAVMEAPLQLAAPASAPTATKQDTDDVTEKIKKITTEPKETDGSLMQEQEMQIKGKSARAMVMEKLMTSRGKTDSVVLMLKNMVGPEDVDEDLQDEIHQECGKYGRVENVVVYQEKQDEADDAEVLVKIFVEFRDTMEAKKAKQALDGRFFGGRTISAYLYDQQMYYQQEFDG